MLQITAIAPASLNANPTAAFELSLSISDTDPFITQLSGSVDWGDGQSTPLGTVTSPYGPLTLVHVYSPGTYQVRVSAQNFRSPVPQTAIFQQKVTVKMAGAARTDAPAVLFGPILPRTNGYPAPNDWSFNLGRDGAVLESSLLMLFLTACGERVHDPEYGTNLRRLIFSQSDDNLNAALRAEISRAVAAHEPRAEFIGSSLDRANNGRVANLTAEFINRLSQQPVVLNVAFAP